MGRGNTLQEAHQLLSEPRTASKALGSCRKVPRRILASYPVFVAVDWQAAPVTIRLRRTVYLRALTIKEKLLGPEHQDVAMTLNNLAVLYKPQHRVTEAARLYRRALAIFEQTLDQSHPKLITCRETTSGYSDKSIEDNYDWFVEQNGILFHIPR